MDGFPRFTGLWVLTAITLMIAVGGTVFQFRHGQHTGAILLAIWVLVMGGGLVSITLLRRRLR